MKIRYDEEKDSLTILFGEDPMFTKDCGEGIEVGYSSDGLITHVEVVDVVARAASRDVFRQIVLEGIGGAGRVNPLIIIPRLLEDSQIVDEA